MAAGLVNQNRLPNEWCLASSVDSKERRIREIGGQTLHDVTDPLPFRGHARASQTELDTPQDCTLFIYGSVYSPGRVYTPRRNVAKSHTPIARDAAQVI